MRRKRLAGTVRKHLSAELAREVKDPRLAALGIEDVEVSGDLSIAKVSVRLMFGDDDSRARTEAMEALHRVAPGLRASLGPVLRMRRVPELRFFYDEGADHRAQIEAVLSEIRHEDDARRQELESGSEDAREPSGQQAGTGNEPEPGGEEPNGGPPSAS